MKSKQWKTSCARSWTSDEWTEMDQLKNEGKNHEDEVIELLHKRMISMLRDWKRSLGK